MRKKPIPNLKHAPIEPIHKRFSGRSFSAEVPEKDVLYRIFEAARWAPSCFNAQPWKFVAGINPSPLYSDLMSTLMDGNYIWAQKAPVIIAACAIDNSGPKGSLNTYADHDLGLAIGQLSVQVTAEGLNMHQLGGFHIEPAQQIVSGIDSNLRMKTMIVLGFPDYSAILDEPFESREREPQQRKALEDVVFFG